MFPFFSKTNTDPACYIHYDGAAFQLFELEAPGPKELRHIIHSLQPGDSFQLYKLRRSMSDRYFLCLRSEIDYSELHMPTHKAFRLILTGPRKAERAFIENTLQAVTRIRDSIPAGARASAFAANPLLEHLVDYEIRGGLPAPVSAVKSNLSALRTGDKKASIVSSVENLDMLPYANLKSTQDYLSILQCVRPPREQAKKISTEAERTRSLFAALAPRAEPSSSSRVDTVAISSEDLEQARGLLAGPYFVSCNFVLSSEAMASLAQEMNAFVNDLHDLGVVLYTHSVASRTQYTAVFPGNAPYGEHYSLCNQASLSSIARRFLFL